MLSGNNARFSDDEMKELSDFSLKQQNLRRESRPFFKKSGFEHGPTWDQRKEFVRRLIHDSTIDPEAKERLNKHFEIIQHFQLRGFKYGLLTSAAVFFFLPVVNRQLFLRRLAISSIPMFVFLKWGHTWGHEKWWRKSYPVIVTYEIGAGVRSKFTGK